MESRQALKTSIGRLNNLPPLFYTDPCNRQNENDNVFCVLTLKTCIGMNRKSWARQELETAEDSIKVL